ncbi:MAG: right-handed parallel beta-helix repeat-containing protein, partial [Pseudomonadota bacterium]
PGLQIWFNNPELVSYEQSSPPPDPAGLPLVASTGTLWIGNSAGNLCGHCHGNNNITAETAAPWWHGPAPILTWTFEPGYTDRGADPPVIMHTGDSTDFRVKYFDRDGDAPASIQVWVDVDDDGSYSESEKYDLHEDDPGDADFTDGKIYARTVALPYDGSGDDAHYDNIAYRFYASDWSGEAIGPPTGDALLRGDLNGIREVPAEYATIQEAIDAAFGGDVILVDAGVFSENLDFRGKEVTLLSASGAAATKIQGTGANSAVVTFDEGEAAAATLDGFTIDNQGSSFATRGVYISNGSEPTIRNSIIAGNSITTTGYDGGGVYINGGGATIVSSAIGVSGSPNGARWGAGLFALSPTTLNITGSVVSYNQGIQGSGIYVSGASSPVTLSGTTVSHNYSTQTAGGLYAANSALSLSDCHVDSNSTSNPSNYDGGGIYLTGASTSATISGGTVSGNSGRFGGGIYVNGSTQEIPLSVTGATISGNYSGSIGGGVYLAGLGHPAVFTDTAIGGNSSLMSGAGMYCTAPLSVTGGSISDNYVTNSGQRAGGLYLSTAAAQATLSGVTVSGNSADSLGGGISLETDADLTFQDGSVSGNRSRSATGGGIAVTGTGTTLNLSRSYVRGNRAAQYGGGIYNTATATLTNCVISGNTADGTSYSDGGGLYSSVTLGAMNCTFAGNYANRYGGGVRIQAGSAMLTNAIVWSNGSGTSGANISGSPSVSYSDVQGGFAGTGNIGYDPLFAALAQASSGNPTTAGDYHLQSGSPAIDRGTATGAPALDIDFDLRPQAAGFDMGADEYASWFAPFSFWLPSP